LQVTSGLVLSDSTAGEGYTLLLLEGRVKISASERSLPDFVTSVVYKHQILTTVTEKKAAVNAFVLNKDLYSIFHSRCLYRRVKVKLSHNK
jgi:hypothetical protein